MRWLLSSVFVLAVFAAAPVNEADAFLFHRRVVVQTPVPTKTVVLEVVHPRTCCKHLVKVCIPCCCTGAPTVHYEPTIIGHGRTVFTWCCGHQVVVRYRCFGGIKVTQRG